MLIKISGGFHWVNRITVRVKDDVLSIGQMRRITKHMCGNPGCYCGPRHGWDGERGELTEMIEDARVKESYLK